jgi:hypothetical protein
LAGDEVFLVVDVASTGSATLSVNGATAQTIKKTQGTANIASGDLKASGYVPCINDGTFWQCQIP